MQRGSESVGRPRPHWKARPRKLLELFNAFIPLWPPDENRQRQHHTWRYERGVQGEGKKTPKNQIAYQIAYPTWKPYPAVRSFSLNHFICHKLRPRKVARQSTLTALGTRTDTRSSLLETNCRRDRYSALVHTQAGLPHDSTRHIKHPKVTGWAPRRGGGAASQVTAIPYCQTTII